MAHHAGGLFLLGKVDKLLEREEQQVVGSDHKHIVINTELVHRKQQVTDSTQTGLVGRGTVIDNGNGLNVMLRRFPFLEDGCETVIGDNDMLCDLGYLVDIIEHTS